MEIQKVIGGRVARRREALGLSQARLGELLGETLERPWTRQSVWAAEDGRRAFTAVELVALAQALDTTVELLIDPPLDVQCIEMPSGATVARSALAQAPPPVDSVKESFRSIHESLGELRRTTEARKGAADADMDTIDRMYDQLGQVIRAWSRESGVERP